MDYRFISNPNTGKATRTDSKKGRHILDIYNKYDYTNEQRGGSTMMVGAIGGVIAIGGLLLYQFLYSSGSSTDSTLGTFKKDLLFISKIDIQSKKDDIIKGMNMCRQWYQFFKHNISVIETENALSQQTQHIHNTLKMTPADGGKEGDDPEKKKLHYN